MSTSALVVGNVNVSFGSRRVLHNVQLTLEAGSWTALVGPNASGKTTLLRCAAGLLEPQDGKISINGRSLHAGEVPLAELPGYSTAPDALPEFLSGNQCLEVYAATRGLPAMPAKTIELSAALGFSIHADSLVRSYSLGTRQKLSVLLALMGSPSIVLLDEVFNGLDPASSLVLKRHIVELVRQQGWAVMLSTHSLDIVARYCDRMLLLVGGRIVRQWDHSQLAALRGVEGIELALAAAEP
jgi:ABC-2 type transport system ATP-binding protein